jgi:hypothetical protein
MFNSALLLDTSAASRARAMERQVADYYALSAMRSDPCLDPHAGVDPTVMPAVTEPALYYRAIDNYGDPAAGRPLNDHTEYVTGLRNLHRPGC